MQIEKALKFYGSRRALAKAAGVTKQAVARWVKRGRIAEASAYRIQTLTKGELKVEARLYARH